MEGFLTPRALARVSGWPEKRIRELIATRELRHIKLKSRYFIPQGALDEFVARAMVGPTTGPSPSAATDALHAHQSDQFPVA